MKCLINIIIASIVISFIMILWYEHNVDKLDKLPKKNLTDLPLRTGDILLCRNDYLPADSFTAAFLYLSRNVLYSSIVGGLYTHAGVICMYKGKPYLYHQTFECSFDNLTQKNVCWVPYLQTLEDYLSYYHGEIAYFKYNGPAISDELTENTMERVSSSISGFMSDFRSLNAVFKIKLFSAPSDKSICSQIIAEMLTKLGIVNIPDRDFEYYNPVDIEKTIVKSNLYSDPVIILNPYIIKKLQLIVKN